MHGHGMQPRCWVGCSDFRALSIRFEAKPILPEDAVPTLRMDVDDDRVATVTLDLIGVTAVAAAELLLEFDPEVFTYLGHGLPDHMAGFFVESLDEDGTLRLAMAAPTAMTSSGRWQTSAS